MPSPRCSCKRLDQMDIQRLTAFVRESNLIEGINREPTREEVEAHERVWRCFSISAQALGDFQAVVAPGKPLRENPGMNVRIGNHVPVEGGPHVLRALQKICRDAMGGQFVWTTHVEFEILHPYMDGNGRTGRALWMWQMHHTNRDPFALSFLHRFYYQTLDCCGGLVKRRKPKKESPAT